MYLKNDSTFSYIVQNSTVEMDGAEMANMRQPTQIEISQQVWVCDACGCQDNKSCSCNSAAHAEDRAAKREAKRQADKRHREKVKQNQQSSDNRADVDNTKEFPADTSGAADDDDEVDHDPPEVIWRRSLVLTATKAMQHAEFYDDLTHFQHIDPEAVLVARRAADAWNKLASQLERLLHGKAA